MSINWLNCWISKVRKKISEAAKLYEDRQKFGPKSVGHYARRMHYDYNPAFQGKEDEEDSSLCGNASTATI